MNSSYLSKAKDKQFTFLFYTLIGGGILIYWVYITLVEQPTPEFGKTSSFILHMFQFEVLLHLIPLVIGWWLARIAALTLVKLLYNLPDRHTARAYLFNRHSPYNKGKAILVTKENLEKLRSESATIGVGGPDLVQISHGEVAITERDGRVLNIREAGIHYLEMLERIHSILDLKPQTRTMPSMLAYTREYVPITADITLRFRIDTGDVDADSGNPYPVNKNAVLSIVYGQNLTKDGPAGWDGKTNFAVRFNLLKIIRRYTMSEIFIRENVRANINHELTPLVKATLKNIGFNLIGIRVTNVRPQNEAVFEQYIKLWKIKMDMAVERQITTDEASNNLAIQTGKVEAELNMIKAIVVGVEEVGHDGEVIDVKTAVSLRFIQEMEELVAHATEDMSEPVSPELVANLETLRLQLREQSTGLPTFNF